MKKKDMRMRKWDEFINGIKQIKLNLLENFFYNKVIIIKASFYSFDKYNKYYFLNL